MADIELSGTVSNDSQGSDSGKTATDTSVALSLDTEPYVGTYRTKQDAEKGLTEKDKTIGRLNNEKGELLAEVKKLREDVLFKLAEAVASQKSSDKPVKSDVDTQAELEKLAKRIDEEGGAAIVDVLSKYGQDIENSVMQRTVKQTEELQKLVDTIRQQVEEQNPEYQTRKETMGELQAKFPNVNRSILFEIAKQYIKPAVNQPARPVIPGTTRGTVTTPDEVTTSPISSAVESLLRTHLKATKEEIEMMGRKK